MSEPQQPEEPSDFEALKQEWEAQMARRTPANLMFEFQDKDERAFVDIPSRVRWMTARAAMLFALLLAVYLLWETTNINNKFPWGVLTGAVFGALILRSAYFTIRRAQSFRNGYLTGRRRLLAEFYAAHEAGDSMDEFVLNTMVADGKVMSGEHQGL